MDRLAHGDNDSDGNKIASIDGVSTMGQALFANINSCDYKGQCPVHIGCHSSPSPSLMHSVAFHDFSYPWPNAVQKYYVENSGNKQVCNFKIHVLRSVMKSLPVLLHPTQPFVQPIRAVLIVQ